MTYTELKYHLPAFLVFFSIISFIWTKYRISKIPVIGQTKNALLIKRIKKAAMFFNLFYIITGGIILTYSFFPDIYHWLALPFISWDIPSVNSFGVMILNISLVWVIVTQMNIDIFVYRIFSGKTDLDLLEKVLYYSSKSFLMGFVIMFIGIFVTISSLAALLLAASSMMIYYRFIIQSPGNDNNTPAKLFFL